MEQVADMDIINSVASALADNFLFIHPDDRSNVWKRISGSDPNISATFLLHLIRPPTATGNIRLKHPVQIPDQAPLRLEGRQSVRRKTAGV